MSKRQDEDGLFRLVAIAILGGFGYLIYEFQHKRMDFYIHSTYIIITLFLLIGGFIFWRKFRINRHAARLNKIKIQIPENDIYSFISKFGHERGKKSDLWKFRENSFSYYRLNDFIAIQNKKNISISMDDFLEILEEYIQKKEEDYTIGNIKAEKTYLFSTLSGSDFEQLLHRLSEKMGYKSRIIGSVGDQGADLILNKGKERIAMQAKCYNNGSVGNDAIQQVVSARAYHDCNKAVVVTTSYFTKEALALAKATSVQLIDKKELQSRLLEFLNESWN
jgi:HJR/Mrr/RecB family endonuclease